MSPSRDVPVGGLVVVWYAGDSYHAVGDDEGNPINRQMRCFDSAGNLYATIAGAGDGGSNIYSQCSIFVGYLRYRLTTSDTITVEQRVVTSGQMTARGMSAEEFSIPPTSQWAVHDRIPASNTRRAADPLSITVSGGQSGREYLYLHALSTEGPNTDAYTWDSDYTQIAGDGTTGGADDENIHIRGGYRIATIASDTVDVASDTADRDNTQVMQSITEIDAAPDGAFPTTEILDDFNRANEDPLGTALANWDTGGCSPKSAGATTRHCELVSNQIKGSAATPSTGGSWFSLTWPALVEGDGFEAFCTLAVAGNVVLHMRGTGCAEAATVDGIAVGWSTASGSNAGDNLLFGSSGNQGAVDQIRGRLWVDQTSGWKIGMQMRRIKSSPAENAIYWWIDRGNGWEIIFAAHAPATGLSGYAGSSGKIGIEIQDTVLRVDDVGGGPSHLFAPQIYRRVFG